MSKPIRRPLAPEIASKLGIVGIVEGGNGLELDNNLLFYHQVQQVAADRDTLEAHLNHPLRLKVEFPILQGDTHGIVIHRFQKAGTQFTVNRYRCPDNLKRKLLKLVTRSDDELWRDASFLSHS